jgi:superfamily II DNA or RNA helicase
MSEIKLRPYQETARKAVEAEWAAGRKRTLLVLPTGCGKTIVFARVAEDVVREGGQVLILAHRGELLDQASDKVRKSTGLECGVEKADSTAVDDYYPVTVGSVQTLMREKRITQYPPDYFSAIVVDEAHHVLSNSYQRVFDYFSDANVLGVTATPDRGDMRNLGQFFNSLAYEYKLPQAIREGYLSPIKAVTIPLKLDLGSVGISQGDFKAGDLGDALEPYLEQIAAEMEAYRDRKTVVFLPLVKTSQKFRDILINHGFRAAEVNGNSDDRRDILDAFDRGEYDVLCNSMLLTEGWDCPSVDCVVVLRPTKVRSLYCQMVGRGTRLHPGKDHLLLLDFLWNTERHELCHPAALICEDAEVAKKMTDNAADNAGMVMDIEDAEKKAAEDVVAQREAALAAKLAEMRKRKRALVDPLQFEMSIQAEDLSSYKPTFGWEMLAPTEAQRKSLEKYGIFPDEIDSQGKASKILDRLSQRRDMGLSTPKQIRLLEGRGFQHVGQWTFDAASKMIGRISANGWRVPPTIDPYTYEPPAPRQADPFLGLNWS